MKNKRYTIADMAEMIAKQEKKFATNPRALKKLAQAKQMLMQTNDAKRGSNGNTNKAELGLDLLEGVDPSLVSLPYKFFTPPAAPELRDEATSNFKNSDGTLNAKKLAGKTWTGRQLSNPNLMTGIFQGAAMLGDFANQMSAINSMEEPSKVALAPQARLNKNMDTSAYRNDANRAFRTQNMIANNAPNQSVANAMRGNIMGQHLNSLGQVNTAANNYRSQMENQEAGLNASINMQNAGIMNDFYSAKNQFANNKRMAKANAFSGLMGNAQLMTKDYRQQAFDKNVRYPMMSKWASAQSQAFLNS